MLQPSPEVSGNLSRRACVRQRPGFPSPQTAGADLARREVHVEARPLHVLSQRMAEAAGRMLPVRTFVVREAHIAVDAEHRAGIRPRIGGDGAPKSGAKCGAIAAMKRGFVRFKPAALVARF